MDNNPRDGRPSSTVSPRRRNPLSRSLEKYVVTGSVTQVRAVTASMLAIRMVADEPITFPYQPGQHIRVQINDPLSLYGIVRPSQTLRTYTIVNFSRPDREVEIWAHLHENDGIGATWARTVQRGDLVTYWWPQCEFHPVQGEHHLFVGEESAAAAFVSMVAAIEPDQPVRAVLESAGPDHDVPLAEGADVRRVHRGSASAASSLALQTAVAELALPESPGVAYVAGEARTCQAVRNHLVQERGWPRKSIKVKPFWTPGKYGLH
ncbi:siderophore-interacting protein [Spiractinospora alimapuensis]|uniref:siderophore-interacting protein n=1 Tax=Spiractinospora alimapuensis TaxID=2820884 RepID=UPI001F462A27|nr:siderophore-interacting protein [Spiractinospora alimapuensis]QVQ52831.1 siderophore-interacting protein [Spiractinospora alimapuensis]